MSDLNPAEQGSFGMPPAPPGHSGGATTPIPSTPQPQPPNPLGGTPAVAQSSAGFLTALFDFSFTHFVTPKLVRFVYILATIALAVAWFIYMVMAFAWSAAVGLAVLLLGPVVLIIYLAIIRMTLEFYLSVVRMSEDINKRLPLA
jgi:hypothetical protein